MTQTKEIKIFLGSSIYDFKNERTELSDFIQKQSEYFERAYNTKLDILMCEDVDPAMTKERKQDKLNNLVRQSYICIFMFDKKVGIFTEEEFDLAYNTFKATNKPIIYPYFKNVCRIFVKSSLKKFKIKLLDLYKQYPIYFKNIDTIKLRLLQTLNETAFNGVVDIKLNGDKILVDGNEMFSTENIAEIANNVHLKELHKKRAVLEKKYYKLRIKYIKGLCSTSEYLEVIKEKESLDNKIDECRENIFNMSLNMCRDEVRGEITQRQREAYRLFEAGDLEEANKILNPDQITSEYEQRTANRTAEQQKDAQVCISQLRTKIDILTAMVDNDNRFNEIEDIYDQITKVAFEQKVEIDVIFDFILFLYNINKLKKASEIKQKLKDSNLIEDYPAKIANLYFSLAVFNSSIISKKDETFMYYTKAIDTFEELAKSNPDRFEPDLAMSYNNAGIFYQTQGQPQKAEDFYNKAITIKERLAKSNPDRFEPDLAGSYNNAGIFYNDQGNPKKAEDFYIKAIAIREKLAKSNPDRFEPDLATSYNNAGNFYKNQGNPKKAEDFYNKAIAIYEQLAKSNPDRFKPDLAGSYNNAGLFYNDQGQPQKAEDFYIKAIAIFEKLAKSNPDRFELDLATSYNNAGNFYKNQGNPKKAEDFYNKAIAIRERLAKSNPDRFEPVLAGSYNNAGAFYYDQGQPQKAEEFYNKAIAIYEKLANTNPDRFEPYLAMSYNNAGNFYYTQGQPQKAEAFFNKAIAIREKLAKSNPDRFEPDLATSYNNIGNLYAKGDSYNPYNFYIDESKFEKAEDFYIKAIDIYEKLADTNPDRFEPNLASSYYNYAIFTDDNELLKKAFDIAVIHPTNPHCRQIIEALKHIF